MRYISLEKKVGGTTSGGSVAVICCLAYKNTGCTGLAEALMGFLFLYRRSRTEALVSAWHE